MGSASEIPSALCRFSFSKSRAGTYRSRAFGESPSSLCSTSLSVSLLELRLLHSPASSTSTLEAPAPVLLGLFVRRTSNGLPLHSPRTATTADANAPSSSFRGRPRPLRRAARGRSESRTPSPPETPSPEGALAPAAASWTTSAARDSPPGRFSS